MATFGDTVNNCGLRAVCTERTTGRVMMAMTRDESTGNRTHRSGRGRGSIRHRPLALGGIGAIALLAAACSSTSTGSSSATAASNSTGSAGGTAVVKVVSVPTYGHILTDSAGKPLYTLSGTCTGACASAWPALTVAAGSMPTGGAGVTGTLSAVKQADGTYQVTYNGSPLYTFVSDSSGNVTGQGVAGFSVVKVSASTPAGATSSTSRNGY